LGEYIYTRAEKLKGRVLVFYGAIVTPPPLLLAIARRYGL